MFSSQLQSARSFSRYFFSLASSRAFRPQYISRFCTTNNSKTVTSERTALYDFHVAQRGKIVNFGGYLLPVQYADQSIIASHLHTRQNASIFDVSHMLQTYVHGKDAIACMESICTADIAGLDSGSGVLTVFTNEKGGILDDLIVIKVSSDLLYVVSNAAMKRQDMDIMESAISSFKAAGKNVSITFHTPTDLSLIAVQGPNAVNSVSSLIPKTLGNLDQLFFMNTLVTEIAGVPDCRITRCGYTGEDGVEISIPSSEVVTVVEALLAADPKLKMAGLGARDSLRLEAGLCLYGSDIDQETTPIEAGLAWLVAKRRRAEQNFPGAKQILEQLKNGPTKRRVGFQSIDLSAPPARAGVQIYHNDKPVGHITSGCPSPSLSRNIAMGYIEAQYNKPGQSVSLKIRNKSYAAEVTKMPFVPTKYYISRKSQK